MALIIGLTGYRLPQPSPQAAGGVAVSSALGGDDNTGYQRVYQPRPFRFPEDHGPHPEFRNEWWYVTGNLADAAGRQFGYQLTLFRIALSPTAPPADSPWRTNQVYMGHFALTDVAGDRHYGFERFSRGALGLAGAQATPFRVWLEDWALTGAESDAFPLQIRAREGDVTIDLTLNTAKPVVLQGDRGLSQKSAEPGNASYYYSMTRVAAKGTVNVAGESLPVTGLAWLDREWSTSMLAPDQAGWDWFSLQLDEGTDLMYFRMRRKHGEDDPMSSGSLIYADGSTRHLARGEVAVTVLDRWRSPGGYDYPSGWQLTIHPTGQRLDVRPVLADQEFRHDARYWEGAVDVLDAATGQPRGRGYVELTGYAPGPVEKSGE
jgi:predicted secreted hydrolase